MTQETQAIGQVLQGDIESFRLIVERYERPIVRMIRNITNNRESCEDIAQDVFFTAYRKLASFDPARSNFSTWLFTIARNIPENHCFVLGDNRINSYDSRHFGPIPLATVKGRADYLYWPAKDWSRFGRISN